MTLPSNLILPPPSDASKNPEDLQKYLKELTYTIQSMYDDVSQTINGDFKLDSAGGVFKWTPTLSTSASETFTYTNQYGISLRQGLLVDLWFDIEWSATSGTTGNLYLDLPYKSLLTNGMPFLGVVQADGITFTGGTGIVINATPNSYLGEFYNVGSGFATANQLVVSSGRVIGHLRYVGQNYER